MFAGAIAACHVSDARLGVRGVQCKVSGVMRKCGGHRHHSSVMHDVNGVQCEVQGRWKGRMALEVPTVDVLGDVKCAREVCNMAREARGRRWQR